MYFAGESDADELSEAPQEVRRKKVKRKEVRSEKL
jgi:hypothetical protein